MRPEPGGVLPRYTADSRDRVREAVDMLAVVSARTELRRAGPDEYVGRCPFHDERTPSFGVDPHKKVYHCFGCQASGDVFRFVMETEGLDFTGALESLADRFGVTLETVEENPQAAARRRRRDRLHELLGRTAGFYARYLWEGREAQDARDYLLGRGLTEETLRGFAVGYAPSAWDRVLLASRQAGYSEEELLAVGLASRSRSGQVYDRFRGRIMFPSADARGRVLGFGARAMRAEQRPKYLNTSDGELYHKRAQLFGIHLARADAARVGRMILVEGYTDVLALHQAGLRNAVGIMGTALTEDQVAELERVVSVLELCLDADRAGQEAMVRAATIARGRKLELRVVTLPDGADPAELIERDGADALRSRVASSQPFAAFHVDRLLSRADARSAEGRDRAIEALAPVLRELPPSVLREQLVQQVAGRLELSEARLVALLSSPAGDARVPVAAARGSGGSAAPAARESTGAGEGPRAPRLASGLAVDSRAERTLLVLCLALPEAGNQVLAAADLDTLLRSDDMRRAARHLIGRCAAPLSDLPDGDDALTETVRDLARRAARAGRVTPERLEHARLVLEHQRLVRAIRRARAERRPGIADLAREREAVWEAIHRVGGQIEKAG